MTICSDTAIANKDKTKYPKEAIIQLIIDHEKLQPFLHPELLGRIPLLMSDRLIGRDVKLKKFGKDVQIVPDKDIKGAYLRFTVFECKDGQYCNIAFEYPIEGVSGSTGVWITRDGSASLEKTEISEIRRR